MRRILLCLAALVACLGAGATAAHASTTGPCLLGGGGPTCHFWTAKVTFVADGDTIDVDLPGPGNPRQPVRFIGINAMELHRYSKYKARRRGDCHGVAAADLVDRLLHRGHMRVRLVAQNPASHSGHRIRRDVETRIGGRWVDVDRAVAAAGLALWLPNHDEWAWNASYSALIEQRAAERVALWNPAGCGAGPSAAAPLRMDLNYDAPHNDFYDINGEWARISNGSGVAVPIAGWRFRDSDTRWYTFPAGAVLPAHGSVTVHVGQGQSGGGVFYWGLTRPAFENPSHDARHEGDGGYLFDPRGNLRAYVIYP